MPFSALATVAEWDGLGWVCTVVDGSFSISIEFDVYPVFGYAGLGYGVIRALG